MQAGEYGAWSFVWLHSAAFHRKGGAPNHNEIFSKEARILYQGAIMRGSETGETATFCCCRARRSRRCLRQINAMADEKGKLMRSFMPIA